jgi:hypothetical protein
MAAAYGCSPGKYCLMIRFLQVDVDPQLRTYGLVTGLDARPT